MDTSRDFLSFKERVHRYEENLIREALEQCGNRVSRAAKLLGISHQHLSLMLRTRHKGLLYLIKQPGNSFKPRKRRCEHLIKNF